MKSSELYEGFSVLFSFTESVLKNIQAGHSLIHKPLKELTLARDASKAVVSLINQDKAIESNLLNDDLSFDQIMDNVFRGNNHSNIEQNSSLVPPSIQGFVRDAISPALSFFIDADLSFTPEIEKSNYSNLTKNIRQKINEISASPFFLETMAAARLLLVNGIINKSAWLLVGCEPLPDPKWLKNTSSYEFSSRLNNSISENTPQYLKDFKVTFADNIMKIYDKKGMLLAEAALETLSQNIYTNNVFMNFSSVILNAAMEEKQNNNINNISNEFSYLTSYLKSQNRINSITKEFPNLSFLIQNDDSSLNLNLTPDDELKEIINKNPVLERIFELSKRKFKGDREKAIFVEALKRLVKRNKEMSNPFDKLWNDVEGDISKGKKIAVKHFFTKAYKSVISEIKMNGVEIGNDLSVNSPIVDLVKDPKILKLAHKLYKSIESKKVKDVIFNLYNFYLIVAKLSINEELNSKNKETLNKLQTFRINAPAYEIRKDKNGREILGTHSYVLANKALLRSAESKAIEELSKTELPKSDAELKLEFIAMREKYIEILRKDPLFSSDKLQPSSGNNVKSFIVGAISAISPWSNKVKLRLENSDKKLKEKKAEINESRERAQFSKVLKELIDRGSSPLSSCAYYYREHLMTNVDIINVNGIITGNVDNQNRSVSRIVPKPSPTCRKL